jgi:DNA-binding CsgD family transcriptional regulator
MAAPAPDRAHLSDREREVLTLISRGMTSAEVASRLYLSPETVRTHARNILAALGARSRAHAVALALRDGMISAPGPERSAPQLARHGKAG